MKRFYINLDRSVDRRRWFEEQASRRGLHFERVSAVEGAALSEAELAASRVSASVPLSAAEIGCLLSHRKVWQMVAEGGDEWVFIAEDDTHLSADAGRFLGDEGWIPAGTELIKAETMLRNVELSRAVLSRPFGHELRRLRSKHFGAGGYFVSRTGAARLLAFTVDRCNPADFILFSPDLGILGEAVVLQLTPAICIQDTLMADHAQNAALVSVIHAQRRERWDAEAPRSGWMKARREIMRLGRQAARAARLAVMIPTGRSIVGKVPVSRLD